MVPPPRTPRDTMSDDRTLDAAFLGPLGENADLLERLVVDALRDHTYWRRNFHPEDAPTIPATAALDPAYQDVVARTSHALHRLAADLKRSVPWFSPRYVGHMASDLLLPGLVARILATLYNPNNVSEDAGGPAVGMELAVGRQLAAMFGMAHDPSRDPCAWGHLTSGGTIANVEGLWNLRAVRMIPLAVDAALAEQGYTVLDDGTPVGRAAGSLANLSIEDALAFRVAALRTAASERGAAGAAALHRSIEAARIEAMGHRTFLERFGLHDPVVVAPASAHYSWSKAMKLLGLGAAQLVPVHVDAHMRLDPGDLEVVLDRLAADARPVLGVIGVLGTTEFGTLDPIDALVRARDQRAGLGQAFGVHVDAAWGGYLASLFRAPDGTLVPRDALSERFRYFPSAAVYDAFAALAHVDAITVDPHKLGFIPYPAGAFVTRHRQLAHLLTESAPYVFDEHGTPDVAAPPDLTALGRYILEGSKPGAAAASVHVTHEVMPLHVDGFGRLIARTIHACESFFDRVRSLAIQLAPVATLTVPFEPDSNVVCLGVNPVGNADPATMNRFMRALFATMSFTPREPLQVHDFIGSFTSIAPSRLTPDNRARLCAELGLHDDDGTEAVFLLRHTLMNPWLLRPMDSERDWVDGYLSFLQTAVERLCSTDRARWSA